MKITEPVTTITDYLLAAELILLGVLLIKNVQEPRRLWGAGFIAAAIAAAAGGTYHGFLQSLNHPASTALWKITIYSVGISALLMLLTAMIVSTSGAVRIILISAAVLAFAVYAVLMISRNDFKYVILFYVPAMVGILLLQIVSRHPSAGWITSGILLSFAAAGAQQSGFRSGQHFNHNDVYHIIQMTAMYLLYRGGRLF